MLQDWSSYHQERACEVLGETGAIHSLEHIQPLAQSRERDVRQAAADAINAITSAERDPAA
ncbi:MAG: HEAT repeat domain-containing protein [Planctomycetota bacterium]|nr:HEAT repeat domain-containing protein [Planctomycetota bacterium]